MKNKLNTRDLINIGIFSAIYIIIVFASNMVGIFPVLMIIVPFLASLVGGIPFMLYMTKVSKFGMVTIMGIIVGFLFFATGHGWPVLVTSVLCGVVADLIFKSGEYKIWGKTLLGYCVFSLWDIGAMLPIWIMPDIKCIENCINFFTS